LIYKDLVAEGKLKKERAIGIDQIHRFISRAKKDLDTARIIVASDEGATIIQVIEKYLKDKNPQLSLDL